MNATEEVGIVKDLLKPEESLSQRAVRGGGWVFALRITVQLLGFTQVIILARLLY